MVPPGLQCAAWTHCHFTRVNAAVTLGLNTESSGVALPGYSRYLSPSGILSTDWPDRHWPFIAIFLLTKLLYAPFYGLSTGFSGCLAQWGHSYSIGCWLFNHLQAFGNFGKEGGAGSFGFQYAVLQDRDGIFRRLRRGEAAEPVIEQLVPCCIKLACLAVPVLPAAVPPAGLAGVADAILDHALQHAAQGFGGGGITDDAGAGS